MYISHFMQSINWRSKLTQQQKRDAVDWHQLWWFYFCAAHFVPCSPCIYYFSAVYLHCSEYGFFWSGFYDMHARVCELWEQTRMLALVNSKKWIGFYMQQLSQSSHIKHYYYYVKIINLSKKQVTYIRCFFLSRNLDIAFYSMLQGLR